MENLLYAGKNHRAKGSFSLYYFPTFTLYKAESIPFYKKKA